jgi:hypothetical protein
MIAQFAVGIQREWNEFRELELLKTENQTDMGGRRVDTRRRSEASANAMAA